MRKTRSNCRVGTFEKKNGLPPRTIKKPKTPSPSILCCDFCWYCVHGKYGEPIQCIKMKPDFEDGMGYCDEFICSIHEPKPFNL